MPVAVIPALALLVAALVALALTYGWKTFVNAVASLIPNWHIPLLGNIRGAVVNLANGAFDLALAGFDATIALLAPLILLPWRFGEQLVGRIVSAVLEGFNTAEWIITSYVPSKVASLTRSIATALTKAENYAAAKVASFTRSLAADLVKAEAYAKALYSTAISSVATVLTKADALAHSLVDHLASVVTSLVTNAVTLTHSLVDHLASVVRADVAALEAKSDAAVAALGRAVATDVTQLTQKIGVATATAAAATLGTISTDIEHVLDPTRAALADAIGDVTAVAAGDFADVTSWIRDIPLTRVTDIAGVTAIAVSTAGALSRYLEKCGMPNCRNLSSIGRLLHDLESVVGAGSFLPAILEMVHDPAGAADELAGVFDDLTTDTVSGIRSLLGVG